MRMSVPASRGSLVLTSCGRTACLPSVQTASITLSNMPGLTSTHNSNCTNRTESAHTCLSPSHRCSSMRERTRVFAHTHGIQRDMHRLPFGSEKAGWRPKQEQDAEKTRTYWLIQYVSCAAFISMVARCNTCRKPTFERCFFGWSPSHRIFFLAVGREDS